MIGCGICSYAAGEKLHNQKWLRTQLACEQLMNISANDEENKKFIVTKYLRNTEHKCLLATI